jgi:peptidoglycan/LPS O-acetylase OafA/YrhL
MRGWAALVVLLSHTFQVFLLNPDALRRAGALSLLHMINATPLRLAMDGLQAVFLFFVISGFALSYPVLTSGSPLTAVRDMALFRYFRLTVPITASCLLAYSLWMIDGYFNASAGQASLSEWLTQLYRTGGSFGSVLKYSLIDVYLDHDNRDSWNPVLWTMSIELLGSFGLFALLTLSTYRRVQTVIAALSCIALFKSIYFGFPFGFLLAALYVRHEQAGRAFKYITVGAVACLVVGVTLASALKFHSIDSDGTLKLPVGTQYRNLVSALLVAGLTFTPAARLALSGPLSTFLGRISFSLYLVHVPIICSLGALTYLSMASAPFWVTVIGVSATIMATSLTVAMIFAKYVEGGLLNWLKASVVASVRRFLPA